MENIIRPQELEGNFAMVVDVPRLAKMLNDISPDRNVSGRTLLEIREVLEDAERKVKALRKCTETLLLAYIMKFGDLEVGLGQRLYVGVNKKQRCRDDGELVAALLEKLNGDLSRFVSGPDGVLCASPWKVGAIRYILGSQKVEELFITEIEQDLRTGVSKKVLKIANVDFVKKGGKKSNGRK